MDYPIWPPSATKLSGSRVVEKTTHPPRTERSMTTETEERRESAEGDSAEGDLARAGRSCAAQVTVFYEKQPVIQQVEITIDRITLKDIKDDLTRPKFRARRHSFERTRIRGARDAVDGDFHLDLGKGQIEPLVAHGLS